MIEREQIERVWVIDYIKAICMIAVVFLHCELSGYYSLYLCFPFWLWLPVPAVMMVSGYTFSMSFSKHNTSIKQYYSPKALLKKYSRYLLPVFPIYIIRVIKNIVVDKESISLLKIIGNFFLFGNSGPGSYYVPCLLVLVIVFPLIYLLIKRGGGTGLLVLMLVNIVYDAVYSLVRLPYDVYRNIFFQYLFAVSCGCYINIYGYRIKKIFLLIAAIVGAVYILAVSYLAWIPVIIQNRATTAWPVCFWVLCFVGFVLIYHKTFKISVKLIHSILMRLGQASYHIFCIQLLWFVSGIDTKMNMWIAALVSIVVSCILGYFYYMVEKKFKEFIKRKGESHYCERKNKESN